MPTDPKLLRIQDFLYNLPVERIAKFPLEQRDASKLLVYSPEGQISDYCFRDLPQLLPPQALLVFNNTKVVQARLFFTKPSGGLIEIFCLEPVSPQREVQLAMQQTGSCTWRCLVGNAKRWKSNTLELHFEKNGETVVVQAEKETADAGSFLIKFSWTPAQLTFAEILEGAGRLPLPPYLNRDLTEADKTRYQTVYAAQAGAVAAPTAGLHFTPAVFESLEKRGAETAYLTLHVGAGTFRPVKADQMLGHDMHTEQISVGRGLVQQLLEHLSAPVIPVGTTSLRSLESLYWLGALLLQQPAPAQLTVTQWQPYEAKQAPPVQDALLAILRYLDQQQTDTLYADTQILIAPGYDFKICSGLITNFHQPESTLLLLVAALVGPDWQRIYEHALAADYRFLSYGDSSLLWRTQPQK